MEETDSPLGAEADYPSQDMVDRRDHLALIVSVRIEPELQVPGQEPVVPHHFWTSVGEFQADLPRLVTEAVHEATGLELFPRPTAIPYQVGPMAGGLGNATDLVLTLAEGVDAIPAAFDTIANTWAVAEIMRRSVAKMRAWASRRGMHAEPVFTPFVLTTLCEDHVRRTFHPRAKLSSTWYSTTEEFWAGYRSPAHPTSDMTYLVTVRAGMKTYCYAVDGRAKVSAHYMKEGLGTMPLPPPDLLQ